MDCFGKVLLLRIIFQEMEMLPVATGNLNDSDCCKQSPFSNSFRVEFAAEFERLLAIRMYSVL